MLSRYETCTDGDIVIVIVVGGDFKFNHPEINWDWESETSLVSLQHKAS